MFYAFPDNNTPSLQLQENLPGKGASGALSKSRVQKVTDSSVGI